MALTKAQQFFHRLRYNKRWYIETFLKIRDKSATIVPFMLNTAQKIVMLIIEQDVKDEKPLRYIVLKARQMGLSTLFEGLIFQDTANNENKASLIIAHEETASSNLFNMSKLFYEEIPELIRPMKKYSNGKILSFENAEGDENIKARNPGLRSKITIATAGTGEVARSATYHNVHASEVAFFPDAKTTMLGLMQCVPDLPNTMVVWESTANGVGDFFHDMWQKAVRGENEFTPIFLAWFVDPLYTRLFRSDTERDVFIAEVNANYKDSQGNNVRTYECDLMDKHGLTYEQMNWRKHTMANKCQGDEMLFMQEYPSTPEEAFISTGRPKFSIKALKKYQTITKEPLFRGYLIENQEGQVIFQDDPTGYVQLWKKPEEDKFYCIGADVAEGLILGDYSCGMVGDSNSFDVDAMWYGKIDPDLFGVELVKLAKYFNQAYLGVENNNHGLTTISTIKRLEYWNLYYSKSYDRINDVLTQKLGWTTSPRTKPLMIDKLAEFLREMYLGIYSTLIVGEAFTYVIEDNGRTNAQNGCNDDTIMATAIMLQLLLEGKGEFYTPEIPIEQRKHVKRDIVDPLFETDVEHEIAE